MFLYKYVNGAFKCFLILIMLYSTFFSTIAVSAEDEIISVSVENSSELAMQSITIQSRVNSIIINDVVANRGNCKVEPVDQALNKLMPGMSNYLDQVYKFSGIKLKKKGEVIKFGEKQIFLSDIGCDIIELVVKTSLGDVKIDPK